MHTKERYGWIAVPRDRSNVPSAEEVHKIDREWFSDPLESWPITDVTNKAREYAQQELPIETFNHSMRVFCYGVY
jgi:cyanamide hydratase